MIERLRFGLLALAVALIVGVPTAHAEGSWPWPVTGDVITAYKNGSDPYAAGQHRGIDIASPVGTPVKAAIGGEVTYAGHLPDGGITATVRSGDGSYLVSYLHMSELAVKRGDAVAAGRTVGNVGTTGKRSATQPHLHLSVRVASSGAYIDPFPLLGPKAVAQQPANNAPAVSQPVHNSAPQAKAQTQAQTNADARTPSHRATRHSTPQRSVIHATQPKDVHVPATGDSVATNTGHVADSARESHASTGKGRVAPPPFPVQVLDSVNLSTPGRVEELADESASSSESSGPPYGEALLLLLVAGAAALALRMRRSGRDQFTPPPLAHREDLKQRVEARAADVVEFPVMHRQA